MKPFGKYRKKIKKSPMNRRMAKSIAKICYTFVVVVFAMQIGKIGFTNSSFSDMEHNEGNTFSAGVWIPVLSLSVSPENPDGNDDFYITKPCVTLKNSLVSDVTIYYEFANDGDPFDGGTIYDGNCVEIDQTTDFSAVAVNNANPSWKSNIVHGYFKLDTTAPFAEITSHDDGDTVSGVAEIRGTVEDLNPHHYWLVVQNSSGKTIAGLGVVNEGQSFTDDFLFDWDTTQIENGTYVIKLEARDAAGNKDPNQAPVPSDPENPTDSVDWVEVLVSNNQDEPDQGSGETPNPGPNEIPDSDPGPDPDPGQGALPNVVLNEILPNPEGSDTGSNSNDELDGEYVELYNNENFPVDLSGWTLFDADDSHELEITEDNTDLESTTIPANGFLTVYRNGDSDFSLNNDGDTVRLFTGYPASVHQLVDSFTYDSEKDEGHSYQRNPDGVGSWIDPVPTPGEKNTTKNSLEDFQEYYGELCFEDDEPVCELSFMEELGILEEEDDEKEPGEQTIEQLETEAKESTENNDAQNDIPENKEEQTESEEKQETTDPEPGKEEEGNSPPEEKAKEDDEEGEDDTKEESKDEEEDKKEESKEEIK